MSHSLSRKYDKYLNSTEIGLVPAQGLRPPEPDIGELVEELGPVFQPKLPHLCKGCDQDVSQTRGRFGGEGTFGD